MNRCVWVIESRFNFEQEFSPATFGGRYLCFPTRKRARGRIKSIKMKDEYRGIKGQVVYRAAKYISTQPQDMRIEENKR